MPIEGSPFSEKLGVTPGRGEPVAFSASVLLLEHRQLMRSLGTE